jgi:antitoxin component of MazEF toxin-antitoxin module
MATHRRIFTSGNSTVISLPTHAQEHLQLKARSNVWVTLSSDHRRGPVLVISNPALLRDKPDK